MYIKAIWGKWSINQLSSLSLSRYLTFWRFGRLSNIVHHAWFESTTDTIKIASDVSWFLNWLISCFYNVEVFIFVSFLFQNLRKLNPIIINVMWHRVHNDLKSIKYFGQARHFNRNFCVIISVSQHCASTIV